MNDMCHPPSKEQAGDLPMRVPQEIRPDLLDTIQAMSRPRRNALFALLFTELAAIFSAPRTRVEEAIHERVVSEAEAHAAKPPKPPSGRAITAKRSSEAQGLKAARDAALEALFDAGYNAKYAAGEVGCTYAIANSVRMDWAAKRDKRERDREAAIKADRRASGAPDEVELPVFDLARLSSILSPSELDASLIEQEIDEPKTMPAVPTTGKGRRKS